MVLRSLFTRIFILTSLYLLLSYQLGTILAAPGNVNVNNPDRVRQRARLLNRLVRPIPYSRLKNEPFISDFIVDDDDFFELAKKQQSDDYGHLRFGKREEMSDDYGHMRFGRSGQDK